MMGTRAQSRERWTLRELEEVRDSLKEQVKRFENLIEERKPNKKHQCVWCKRWAMRRNINLWISLYYVDDPFNPYESETCCKFQCPHCEKWTRHYQDGWENLIENRSYFKNVQKGRGSPGEWRNA